LSGTTAVSVCFHGGRMTICNVGDSRVLLGHRIPSKSNNNNNNAEESKEEEKCEVDAEPQAVHNFRAGELLAIPLTRDQTPYRKDERERVRKFGAEIKSIDQMEGRMEMHDNWGDMVLGKSVDIEGDPPRVWVRGKEYPGTAFTRSIGDRLAENIGVCAEPEIITTYPTVNDEFLVIASDGIFEFLTNDDVLNICAASLSPQEACEVLTRAAYDKWLEHELRTDDITVIVCFLSSSFNPSSREEEVGTTEALVEQTHAMYGTEQVDVGSSARTSKSDSSSVPPAPMESASANQSQEMSEA
jgi:serine/threonine protein phosphatase PrpC